MTTFFHDIRYALRVLGKYRGFTAVTILTLALGIGINTAFFSLLDIAFRPLPVRDPETVVDVTVRRPVSFSEYNYLRERNNTFSDLVASESLELKFDSSANELQSMIGEFVSDNFFSVLETNALRGRTLAAAENNKPGLYPVAVLSHSAWQKRFGGAETVIGQTLQLNDTSFQIVGVMPSQFVGFGISGPGPTDVWLPIMMRGSVAKENADWFGTTEMSPTRLRMYGRLKPAITLAGAQAEISLLFNQLAPDIHPEALVRPLGITGTKPEPTQSWIIRSVAMIPFGIVLLISCANIANLALARGAARRKEIGVRMSLGATRRRVVRQLLTESMVLALAGGAAGLLFAWWSLKALLAAEVIPASPDLPLETIALYLTPNLRVLGFTGLLSLGATVVFGLIPALRATGENLSTALKDETSLLGRQVGRSTLRSSLVIGQLALCLMLLIATGLLVRGMAHLRKSNPIVRDPHLAIADFKPDLAGYDDQRSKELRAQLVQRLKSTEGIQSVSFVRRLPFEKPDRTIVTVENGNSESRTASYNTVSADYFRTLGVALIRGTEFTADQLLTTSSVIVTQETAKRLWPNQDPLGQKLRLEGDSSTLQVISVVPDVTNFQSGQTYPLYLFLPLTAERESMGGHILLRSDRHAQEILANVRNAGTSLDSTLVVKAQTLANLAANTDEVASARAAMGIAAGLALLALALSAIGLYGVMSYTVSQRIHEVGIRIALGAQRRDILGLIARQGFRLMGIGLVLGIAGGVAVSRVLSALLFGLSPLDLISYASVSLFLAVVAAVAMYIPARRATRIDPIVALRPE